MDENDIKRLIGQVQDEQAQAKEAEDERQEQQYRRNSERWIRGFVHRMVYFRTQLAEHPELENVAEEMMREYGEQYIRAGFR